MTTANKITIVRILFVPFFVIEVLYYVEHGGKIHRLLAFAAFILAAVSDGIDGYIARRYHQRSELGAVLDPLADKLLLATAVVVLSFDYGGRLPRLPLWLAGTLLGRDFILLLGLGLIHHFCGKAVVRPMLLGKAATVLQMLCVSWALLKWPKPWLTVWAALAALATGISGIFYVIDGVRQLSTSPRSAATPRSSPPC